MSNNPKHILQTVQTSQKAVYFLDEMEYFDRKVFLAELSAFQLAEKFSASCGSTAKSLTALHWTSTSASCLQPTP